MKKIPAIITTDKRGVFMGLIDESEFEKETLTDIVAEEVRMCVYWSSNVKGVVGLAHHGPDKESRITSPTKKAKLVGVTALMAMTDKALEAWRAEPWG